MGTDIVVQVALMPGMRIGAIQVPFEGLCDTADGALLWGVLPQRPSLLKRRREKLYGF